MLGDPLLRLEETDSTNRVALEWDDAPHGACVVARSQSGGRGRLGRSWSSPPDQGLYLSLILRPAAGTDVAAYSLLSALCAAHALEALTVDAVRPLALRVKWPNDVICLSHDGAPRKVGGILCEAKTEVLVVGVGLNVNQNEAELPERPIFPASSLALESGTVFEVERVLQALLAAMRAHFAEFEASGWAPFRTDFKRRCYGLGEIVRVRTSRETHMGLFEGLCDDGSLLLRATDGLKRIVAGDVDYL